MTDTGVHPITFSGATERARRFTASLERSTQNEAMARSTYYALEELPNGVLRDMGLARSEIPFVACDLAARHYNSTTDAAEQSPIARSPTARSSHIVSRLGLVAVVAVSTFVIAACTVLARDAKIARGTPDVTRLLGGPEIDFPRSAGPAARQLLF